MGKNPKDDQNAPFPYQNSILPGLGGNSYGKEFHAQWWGWKENRQEGGGWDGSVPKNPGEDSAGVGGSTLQSHPDIYPTLCVILWNI